MTEKTMQLVDWLDDLCVRFIINLPHEELQSVERICFQIEEAQWFYEDFLRPLDPSLPSMNLRRFSMLMFQHCPLSSGYSELLHTQAYENFLAYKTRVPVRGAIMLNHDMTQAVLVKGWKKGAKWSFPRGKINKDEADLDCAVREVYEETGYDLKAAGLVRPEEQMKKIAVSMREQNMLLYVFRGVPMDTRFEPRTRKEISKISWYKLTDLPTVKKKHHTQQGTGADLIKENSFYMVAPFLAPLKSWIKQQHKLDKQLAKAGGHLAGPTPTAQTELEDITADEELHGENTAEERVIPDTQATDGNFAELVAGLRRSHRASDALPEVTAQEETQQVFDAAAELKRLLSVGASFSLPSPPVEAPATIQTPGKNPLLAMLHASNKPPAAPLPPRTPYDQIIQPPPLPHSPHGQHHPRPPHLEHLPPPPFQFQTQKSVPFRNPPYPNTPQLAPNEIPSFPLNFMPLPPRHDPQFSSSHAPNIQQAFSQQAPRPYQRTGDPQFAQPTQFPGLHGPAIPPASKLPAPKLNAHAISLLNTFKSQKKPTLPHQQPQNSQKPPPTRQPPALQRDLNSFILPSSLPNAHPYAPSPPALNSPPQASIIQPAQPKPRSAQQENLLNLLRSPSVPIATPPPPALWAEPVELSAHPTPGQPKLQMASQEASFPKPDLSIKPNLLEAFDLHSKKSDLTSATITRPLNAPDFETVKKNSHHDLSSHSRGPSPAGRKSAEQRPFMPTQILKREKTPSQGPRREKTPLNTNPGFKQTTSPQTTSTVTTPQATTFKPTILRRPQQNASSDPTLAPTPPVQVPPSDYYHSTSPQASVPPPFPPAQPAFDRRETLPADQKTALLSLFGKPSQLAKSPIQSPASPLPDRPLHNPPSGLPSLPSHSPLPKSPLPPARSPQPPTPKSIISGVISPISPLPDKGSQTGSPAHLASRSRISSIGESVGPSVVIPQNAIPTSHPRNVEEGYESVGSAASATGEILGEKTRGRAIRESRSPVDKGFLMGFLEDVARRGR
ncbi:hypothetical protein CC78DRAFT_501737 [Lojkania enalia]|uniref:Nudix hydrolase domain-containing protein n=1 Tax=Lojkania enalia TaxID=147567 RepID=A0A9P4K577_9PLEO|nr:hypothetical protein CC78DRAFT_501737 [Didymosphaeria enalia]